MDFKYGVIAGVSGIGILVWIWRVLNWLWITPKRLEKRLMRELNLKGNPYRFLYGDVKEITGMSQEAKTKPMSFSNDIIPRVLPFFDQIINKYGKDSLVWLGPRPMVFIMDPESIKEILTKHTLFHKPNGGNPLGKLLAQGLISYEDNKWAKHRKIINPAFHIEKLKLMLPAFYTSCSEMLTKWEEIMSQEGPSEIDVWPYLQDLTSDVISRTAFGSNFEEGRRIFELQREQADLIIKLGQSIYIPGMRFLPTKANKRMKWIANEVRGLIIEIIEKRMRAIKAGEAPADDLLSILLESNFNEIKEHGDQKDSGMSRLEVVEECKLFYFAGQETTSVLLVFTMIMLSKHQDWQARAREEVFQVFGNETPDLEGLNRLKVVTMILYEVLRLYPAAIALVRSITEDTKLGKLSLPAGVEVQLPIMFMHHDVEIWGKDAKEFCPERFSEGVSKATKGKVVFFPFGWGPRICIGQNFALAEAKMVLSMILQKFNFELSPSYAHAPCAIITLHPQYGAQLILHKL